MLSLVATAVLVGDDGRNPLPYVVYVLCWVGIVPLSLPRWVGYWPAALWLLNFVWLELAGSDRDSVTVLLLYLGCYAAVQLGASLLFGARWFATGDGFEVYSSVVATMSPLGRRGDGRLVVRNPLDGAATFGPAPGIVVLIAVLLGSTFFDTVSGSAQWARAIQSVPAPATLLDTAGLLVMIALVALTFVGATLLAGRAGDRGRRPVPGLLAHTIIPIVVGYVIAHYFSLLLFQGPQGIALLAGTLDGVPQLALRSTTA